MGGRGRISRQYVALVMLKRIGREVQRMASALCRKVRCSLLSQLRQLREPHADTLNGSKHANMKELRADTADKVMRVAFTFEHERAALLLVAGDKSGVSQKRFEVRRLAGKSQQEVANTLGMKQPSLSKLEKQADMQLSTLRKIVKALGGELEVLATFPKAIIKIEQFD